MNLYEECCCGKKLHYNDKTVEAHVRQQVAELGSTIRVEVLGAGSWMIPRHYIALHGVAGSDIRDLAKKYGWEEIHG